MAEAGWERRALGRERERGVHTRQWQVELDRNTDTASPLLQPLGRLKVDEREQASRGPRGTKIHATAVETEPRPRRTRKAALGGTTKAVSRAPKRQRQTRQYQRKSEKSLMSRMNQHREGWKDPNTMERLRT